MVERTSDTVSWFVERPAAARSGPSRTWFVGGATYARCPTQAANPLQLTDVEENTCDNCRRQFPGQGASFTLFVFRQDLLMLHGSACDECTASFETKGVTAKDL